jgi:hypothetical protein
MMKKSVFALALVVALFAGATSQAKGLCRKSAISAAKIAAPNYRYFFDLNPIDETPDIITYDVTLANVMPDPTDSMTIQVALSKTTCALIENPVQK